jgi:hypothetical protein
MGATLALAVLDMGETGVYHPEPGYRRGTHIVFSRIGGAFR